MAQCLLSRLTSSFLGSAICENEALLHFHTDLFSDEFKRIHEAAYERCGLGVVGTDHDHVPCAATRERSKFDRRALNGRIHFDSRHRPEADVFFRDLLDQRAKDAVKLSFYLGPSFVHR